MWRGSVVALWSRWHTARVGCADQDPCLDRSMVGLHRHRWDPGFLHLASSKQSAAVDSEANTATRGWRPRSGTRRWPWFPPAQDRSQGKSVCVDRFWPCCEWTKTTTKPQQQMTTTLHTVRMCARKQRMNIHLCSKRGQKASEKAYLHCTYIDHLNIIVQCQCYFLE